MDKVLVTGSLGFVGRTLSAKLREAGYDVWGIDKKVHSVKSKSDDPTLLTSRSDLLNEQEVADILDQVGPKFIVHLAAQSSAGRSFSEPHGTITNNVFPVLNILEYMRKGDGGVRLLAVGSADVYGSARRKDLPLRESLAPTPTNPYALSKAMQEMCCVQYASLYDVDVVSTRSFNHTGHGQLDTFVLSSFARQIVEIQRGTREPVVEVGNVDVKRDFTDVRDVCGAYIALLEKGKTGEVYNVCSGRSVSLRVLLERLASIAGVRIKIRVDRKRVRPVDMDELRGDNSKIIKHTGWSPSTPIVETLRSLLDFWSETIAQPSESGEQTPKGAR